MYIEEVISIFLNRLVAIISGLIVFYILKFFFWIDSPIIGIIIAIFIGIPFWIFLKGIFRRSKKAIAEANYHAEKTRRIELENKEREEKAAARRKEISEREAKEQRRRNTPCDFNKISKEEFETIAKKCAKRIRRLTISVSAPIVNGTVQSQSGISEWNFKVDFNDFGKITGSWWMLYRGNCDSDIPNRFANLMMKEIGDKLTNKVTDTEN